MGHTISGTGMFVPDAVVTNADLQRLMTTDEDWIVTRTGVRERRLADIGVATSDLAIEAGRRAISDAGLETADIDALIVATMTPDQYAPGSAPVVQSGLGLGPVPTYGIRQQCSGFVYGLELADALISSDKADRVLVIGAEVHAGVQPWSQGWRALQHGVEPTAEEIERNDAHRHWAVIFGDGAGAAVLERAVGDDGLLATRLHTDGTQLDLILVPAMGSRHQPLIDAGTISAGEHMPTMNGPGLYRQAVRLMPEVINEVLADTGLVADDIDVVVAHQANVRIVDGVAKRFGLDRERVPINLDRYGNTTAATLPILYHELRATQRIGPGALVCFVAFGAGAHWGAALYREPRRD